MHYRAEAVLTCAQLGRNCSLLMALPWSEARVYPVRVGKSFAKGGASLHTLQYGFKPASLEAGAKGVLDVSGAQLTIEATPASGGDTPVHFKGQWSEAKEGECVLIWDEDGFRLEKVASAAKALRPIAAPTQRTPKRPRTPGQRTPTTSRKSASEKKGEKEKIEKQHEEEELDEARVDAELEDLLAAD